MGFPIVKPQPTYAEMYEQWCAARLGIPGHEIEGVTSIKTEMFPYRCPVCEGKRIVPVGFYGHPGSSDSATSKSCRTCNGTGVVWR